MVLLILGFSLAAEGIAQELPLAGRLEELTVQIDRIELPLLSRIPVLPDGMATVVGEYEQLFERIVVQKEAVKTTMVQSLLDAAQTVIHVRSWAQGEQWWETADARQRLADLRQWLTLTDAQRAELVEAAELHRQVRELSRTQNYEDALAAARKSLAIQRRIWGESHPRCVASLISLARLYEEQGVYALALPLFERALAIAEEASGPVHPNTARSLTNLARFYQDDGRYALALPLFERALAITVQVLGPDHPKTGTAREHLLRLLALYHHEA
ncbi:MAG: tetratricopeptide repeat protein [Nitrospirota bacterium]|nr:tetratricopeptide repeat protein [Nitrospirota bacterium]